MGATADPAADTAAVAKLGFKPGQIVQEFGWDEQVDEEFRTAVEELVGGEILDEDADEVADVVLCWYRDGDGDLVDALVDAITNLADGGIVWLLTPKKGRTGHVPAAEIDEAAPTAGLHATSSVSASGNWAGTRMTTPKSGRR
ncbi:DUF3052 domain-containing protein [Paenibacillus sp. TRM 82003]|uniref:DUF3052 domain-containing protein n=1 Tax=Kineococcus sp. TRM81007 TaxID=2925831 RepID=UPI001F5706F7|nr:DUF3052 domain-containing protein [Kineococcus sp. TRM81007]MCI2240160.1 DUF3052 domain-containing protein [Kineococcus sp. TRM81007]MCI3925531.1 DUF3052 domain-containing protein [Paenibacillus sp. TRM 82003]